VGNGIEAPYLAARRVLLDALEALQPQLGALVLAGAQAVYLRTDADALPVAPFTTDGDLAVDPRLLGPIPALEGLMESAGFRLDGPVGAEEPGIWKKQVTVEGVAHDVPIDLIVPAAHSPGGRRAARLEGHQRRSARKSSGLEAAPIDNDVMVIEALEPEDPRSVRVRVAGTAALLVAKATVTESALERFGALFGRRGGAGIEMATSSLRGAIPEERVQAICLAYSRALYEGLGRKP